jgi:acyl-CoA thioester hydrolase
MDDFSTRLELRIDWSEIDLFGHVNNLAIMKYVQAARVCFLETIGLMQLQSETKVGPILASANCQFCKPLFYPGKVTVFSSAGLVKDSSFEIQHAIYDESGNVAAQAKDIIVYFDFIQHTKRSIPANLREKIENLGKNKIGA